MGFYIIHELPMNYYSLSPQAKDVYTTLRDNNVPAELPSFLLSQISEVVETQIMYCRHLGNHISTALKVPMLSFVL